MSLKVVESLKVRVEREIPAFGGLYPSTSAEPESRSAAVSMPVSDFRAKKKNRGCLRGRG
jgi:hypothetical protein